MTLSIINLESTWTKYIVPAALTVTILVTIIYIIAKRNKKSM